MSKVSSNFGWYIKIYKNSFFDGGSGAIFSVHSKILIYTLVLTGLGTL